jgi:ribosomal protein L37AE/L43A
MISVTKRKKMSQKKCKEKVYKDPKQPVFVCNKCGRKAKKEKRLCKAKAL